MKEFEREPDGAWVDDRLDAYVDGMLSAGERRRIEEFVRTDARAAEQLRAAQLVRERLDAAATPACPPDLTRSVLARVGSELRAESREAAKARRRAWFERAWETVLKPSLAAGCLVAVVVASALVGRAPAPPPENVATAEEVEQALNDAKWAIALISDLGRETGESIRRDVLEERVSRPVRQAIGAAFDDEPNS